ncbi:D-serine ammonia-lyase [Bacillus kexueae]|uniref:D-serine ammonia-lyase n=1 Tax=Aeribacillus kexueae TaxID=2078952 RepID=UPI001FAEA7A0|nr:D-serine ammonia-lyase [Bacillus kexueae]
MKIHGKGEKEWHTEYPILKNMMDTKEVCWINPHYASFEEAIQSKDLTKEDVKEASERLVRFAPYLAKVFPETAKQGGIIESPLVSIKGMKEELEKTYNVSIEGEFLLKCDSHLAVSGSIKARGGIYEVLKHAEDIAVKHGFLTYEDDYSILAEDRFKQLFSRYSIAVGSTGNLGLSIGIMSAQLGFNVYVHMSQDAKEWKKNLLRQKGVNVIEYASDYSFAVEEGRKQAERDPNMYFVDDENSKDLFFGYAVAAERLKKQLDEKGIVVSKESPLFVYLPCGVGGGPGGVAFGLKLIFEDNVHCFFAEPTESPCMLLGMMTGLHEKVSVFDFGIHNQTDADGLAVPRPSGFVGRTMEKLLSGIYTVKDQVLYRLLKQLADTEGIYLEPSALAGVYGPVTIRQSKSGEAYFAQHLTKQATHIAWATGGSMVPKEIMNEYYRKGEEG